MQFGSVKQLVCGIIKVAASVRTQTVREFFSLIILITVGAVIVFVVSLSVLAEVVSPRVAGLLSGCPLTGAVVFFVMGINIGPRFAAQSAFHSLTGVVATMIFIYSYYWGSVVCGKLGAVPQILSACFLGIVGYFAAAFLLSFVHEKSLPGLLLPFLAIPVFIWLFRKIENVKISQRKNVSPAVLLFRALFTAGSVALIISTARIVGPTWAGLFSSFPNQTLPLLVIIHFTYNPEHAYAILKNSPKGLASYAIYCLTVSLVYPVYGIYAGTALGYATTVVYFTVTQLPTSLLKRRQINV